MSKTPSCIILDNVSIGATHIAGNSKTKTNIEIKIHKIPILMNKLKLFLSLIRKTIKIIKQNRGMKKETDLVKKPKPVKIPDKIKYLVDFSLQAR